MSGARRELLREYKAKGDELAAWIRASDHSCPTLNAMHPLDAALSVLRRQQEALTTTRGFLQQARSRDYEVLMRAVGERLTAEQASTLAGWLADPLDEFLIVLRSVDQ